MKIFGHVKQYFSAEKETEGVDRVRLRKELRYVVTKDFANLFRKLAEE